MRERVIRAIREHRLIAIVRGVDTAQVPQLAQALYEGGIRLIEVTFDQKRAPDDTRRAIELLVEKAGERMLIGAGTVTNLEQLRVAHEAGASYIIAPDANPAVIEKTRELGLVSIPGALTPNEVMRAHEAGADFVKLFPISAMGPDYVKAMRAPINHIALLGVGGIDEGNMPDYLAAGLDGFGIGGSIVNGRQVKSGLFDDIAANARRYVDCIKTAMKNMAQGREG